MYDKRSEPSVLDFYSLELVGDGVPIIVANQMF